VIEADEIVCDSLEAVCFEEGPQMCPFKNRLKYDRDKACCPSDLRDDESSSLDPRL
jgi:hypothetical protein